MSKKITLTMLKKHRSELDITQDALAEMVDVTKRTIQRIESGYPTSISTAKAISSVLQLPSYHVLTDTYEKEQQPNHEKIKLWSQKLKRGLLKSKDSILLLFASVLALCAMIPIEHDYLIYVLFLYATLPTCTLIVTTIESKTKDNTVRRVSLRSWAGIITSLTLAQLTATPFIALSFMQIPDMLESAKQMAFFTHMPGVNVFTQTWSEHASFIWKIMGFFSFISLYGIYFFVNKAKQQGEGFGSFSKVFFVATLVIIFIGNMFRHTTFFSSIKADTMLVSIVLPLATWLGAYFIARVFFKEHRETLRDLKISVFAIWLTSAITIGVFTYSAGKQEHLVALELDYDYRNHYCQMSKHNLDVCWAPALIEKHNLPMTAQNTELLDALNGQIKALYSSLVFIEIPAAYILERKPLPKSFYQFYSRGYASALSNSKDLSFLAQKYKEKDVRRLLHDPKDELDWAIKAHSDFQGFIDTFPDAPESVQRNAILSMFYKTFTSQWEKKIYKNGNVTYSVPGLHITVEDGTSKPAVPDAIALEQLEKILAIPETEYPKNRLR